MIKVLSLFDGMSCGRVALERAGVDVSVYFASEIDKHAIAVSRSNHPDIVQLGEVSVVRRMAEAGIFNDIDLIIAGSPCQGFSFAGKQLAFDDPRSMLFFEFVKILEIVKKANPAVKFLLENVRMKKEFQAIITQFVGVEPIKINSALVCAQNRVRFYWCNWQSEQPKDKGVLLKDIIENGAVDRDKSLCVTTRVAGGATKKHYFEKNMHQMVITGGAVRGRYDAEGKTQQTLEINGVGKANAITTVQKDSLIVKEATKKGFAEIEPNCGVDLTFPQSKTRRGRKMKDKSNCLNAKPCDYNWYDGVTVRKLSPVECERLQTLPDDYTVAASKTQRYKMLGNGWTVDVVAHLLRGMS